MEFKFNLNDIFKEPVVEIDNTFIPPGFKGDKRKLWDTQSKVTQIVNAMGEASAAAQNLTKPITTTDRLRNSEHKLYFLIDKSANQGMGAVTGMLKIGQKGLYVFDREGQHYQVTPPCVLDFYVHESRQRQGLGKYLFEHMLKKIDTEPVKMAIDRPSDKFLGFLDKHYHLNSPVKQMNNYVVFDGFFPRSRETSAKVVENNSSTSTKSSANGLQHNYQQSPYGRYGARRPPCSMGQIIHNDTSVIQKSQEATGVRSEPVTNVQAATNNYSYPVNPQSYDIQSTPNIYYNYSQNPQSGYPNTAQTIEPANYQDYNYNQLQAAQQQINNNPVGASNYQYEHPQNVCQVQYGIQEQINYPNQHMQATDVHQTQGVYSGIQNQQSVNYQTPSNVQTMQNLQPQQQQPQQQQYQQPASDKIIYQTPQQNYQQQQPQQQQYEQPASDKIIYQAPQQNYQYQSQPDQQYQYQTQPGQQYTGQTITLPHQTNQQYLYQPDQQYQYQTQPDQQYMAQAAVVSQQSNQQYQYQPQAPQHASEISQHKAKEALQPVKTDNYNRPIPQVVQSLPNQKFGVNQYVSDQTVHEQQTNQPVVYQQHVPQTVQSDPQIYALKQTHFQQDLSGNTIQYRNPTPTQQIAQSRTVLASNQQALTPQNTTMSQPIVSYNQPIMVNPAMTQASNVHIPAQQIVSNAAVAQQASHMNIQPQQIASIPTIPQQIRYTEQAMVSTPQSNMNIQAQQNALPTYNQPTQVNHQPSNMNVAQQIVSNPMIAQHGTVNTQYQPMYTYQPTQINPAGQNVTAAQSREIIPAAQSVMQPQHEPVVAQANVGQSNVNQQQTQAIQQSEPIMARSKTVVIARDGMNDRNEGQNLQKSQYTMVSHGRSVERMQHVGKNGQTDVQAGGEMNSNSNTRKEEQERRTTTDDEELHCGYPPQSNETKKPPVTDTTNSNSTAKLDRPNSLSIQVEEEIKKEDKFANDGVHNDHDSLNDEDEIDNVEEEIRKVVISSDESKISPNIGKKSATPELAAAGKSTPGLTEQGFFDLKFYHNKLW